MKLVFLFSALVAIARNAAAACTGQTFTNSVTLDPTTQYTVDYRVDRASSTLIIQLKAKTTGWLGFGFSESGHMLGSDIVTGAVVNGQPRVEDRFAQWQSYPFTGSLPQQDKCNSWSVICASEDGGFTQLVLSRALDTNDTADRPIVNGDMYVVYAWGDSDTIVYHGSNRGTTSINFLSTDIPFGAPPDSDGYIDLTIDHFSMEPDTSQYILQKFDIGTDTKHVVAVQPLISESDWVFAHHMVVHDCGAVESAPPLTFLPAGLPVNAGNISPLGLGACQGLLASWAKGGIPFTYPSVAGYKIGPTSARYIILEIHMNNPDGLSGNVITSGIRLYTTSKLRQYDVGTLLLGDAQVRMPVIPAFTAFAHYESTCPTECLQTMKGNFTVFHSFPHMHAYGRQIWTTKYSADGSSLVVAAKQYWNYGFQDQQIVNFVIQPTDKLSTHCVYDTTQSDTAVAFGPNTSNEMCMHFLMFYPKQNGGFQCGYRSPTSTLCQSGTVLNVPNPEPDGATAIPAAFTRGQQPLTCPSTTGGDLQSTSSPTAPKSTLPPTKTPTNLPTSNAPSKSPTQAPTLPGTDSPTKKQKPETDSPTKKPKTLSPTKHGKATDAPSAALPSPSPTVLTASPSLAAQTGDTASPTATVTSISPSISPSTTVAPSAAPLSQTGTPAMSNVPSASPANSSTIPPTTQSTPQPTIKTQTTTVGPTSAASVSAKLPFAMAAIVICAITATIVIE